MGPPDRKPDFPDLEWTLVPQSQRYASRHMQGMQTGCKAGRSKAVLTRLTSLFCTAATPSRAVASSRRCTKSFHASDFGGGIRGQVRRDPGNGSIMWNMNVMLMPFHKIISSIPHAAHVWAPIDDENTMLYSVDFHPSRHFSEEDTARSKIGLGIHTENIPGTDHAVRNRANDYLIDRAAGQRQVLYRHDRVRHPGLRHPGIDGADCRPHRRTSARLRCGDR